MARSERSLDLGVHVSETSILLDGGALLVLAAFSVGGVLLGRGLTHLWQDAEGRVLAVRRRRLQRLGRSLWRLTGDAGLLVATFWVAGFFARPALLWFIAGTVGGLVVAWMAAMSTVASRAEAGGGIDAAKRPDREWLARRVTAHRTGPLRSAALVTLWLWAWWPAVARVLG